MPMQELPRSQIELRGSSFSRLMLDPECLNLPFPIAFEEVAERLCALERMFFEPDGSFVWVSDSHAGSWQIEGVLYDRAEQLQHVDLRGACPEEEWNRLLSAMNWPNTNLVFELAREAVFLDDGEFRRYAGWRG